MMAWPRDLCTGCRESDRFQRTVHREATGAGCRTSLVYKLVVHYARPDRARIAFLAADPMAFAQSDLAKPAPKPESGRTHNAFDESPGLESFGHRVTNPAENPDADHRCH